MEKEKNFKFEILSDEDLIKRENYSAGCSVQEAIVVLEYAQEMEKLLLQMNGGNI